MLLPDGRCGQHHNNMFCNYDNKRTSQNEQVFYEPTGKKDNLELSYNNPETDRRPENEFKIEVFQDPRTLIKVLIKGMG